MKAAKCSMSPAVTPIWTEIALIHTVLRHPDPPQDAGELRAIHLWLGPAGGGSTDGRAGGDAVDAMVSLAVKAANRHRIEPNQRD